MRRALGALVLVLAGCAPSDETDDTLAPVGSAATVATSESDLPGDSVAGGPVGSGVVRLRVRLSGQGVDEELLFDRSSVAVADLDPIALDATCTALDGGAPYRVAVVDLRRLSAGERILSARLVLDGDVTPGEHGAVLELGDAAQQITRFEGVAVLDEGLATGTFELAAANGAPAVGSFACASDVASLPTTTTVPPAPVDTDGPSGTVAPTAPIVVASAPPLTVPRATS